MKKTKLFRDPVHGYITIDIDYCSEFVDTNIFQRLRRVEQTSMRVLYPSAHHDRFAHSLGVFHLGKKAISNIKNNSDGVDISETIYTSFELACLLHDCAHSPFSHTFEKYYVFKREKEINDKLVTLCKDDGTFEDDLKNCSPAPHEKISAIVVLEHFNTGIQKFGGDPVLIARMILGCNYSNSKNQIENCFIKLLNGLAIDVDKLDYIARDTWASGVNNVKIDDERLLSSLLIRKDIDGIYKVFFKKHALSVIKNVIDGRNFLYDWIYNHHKVVYEQFLITEALKEISIRISDNEDDFFNSFFSIETLYSPKTFNNYSFYLPSDGDLMYLFKSQKNSECINELISRNYIRKALWKTKAEFMHHFKGIEDKEIVRIKNRTVEKINEYLISKSVEKKCVVQEIKPKTLVIEKNQIFVDIDGEELSYSELFPENPPSNQNYFLLYVPIAALGFKEEIIAELRKLKV